MGRRDTENEGIGIVSIVIIVILSTIGLYYFFSSRHHAVNNESVKTSAPLEVPAPPHDHPEK